VKQNCLEARFLRAGEVGLIIRRIAVAGNGRELDPFRPHTNLKVKFFLPSGESEQISFSGTHGRQTLKPDGCRKTDNADLLRAGAVVHAARPNAVAAVHFDAELPGLLCSCWVRLNDLSQQLSESAVLLMELRFRVFPPSNAIAARFLVLRSPRLRATENSSVPGGQFPDRRSEHTIDRAGKAGCPCSIFTNKPVWHPGYRLIQRNLVQALLADMHQNRIDREAIEPGGDCRVTSKRGQLAEHLQKRILRKILGLRGVVVMRRQTE